MASTPAPLPSLGLLDGLGTAPVGQSPGPLPHLGLLGGLGNGGATYTLTADHATVNVQGSDAYRDISMVAGTATVNVAGQSAGLAAGRKLVAGVATVNVSGQSAGLAAARKLVASHATVNIAGQDATLTYSGAAGPDYTLTADVAVVNVAGQSAAITAARKLVADAAVVNVIGQTVSLIYDITYTLVCDVAVVNVSGQSATLLKGGSTESNFYLPIRAYAYAASGTIDPSANFENLRALLPRQDQALVDSQGKMTSPWYRFMDYMVNTYFAGLSGPTLADVQTSVEQTMSAAAEASSLSAQHVATTQQNAAALAAAVEVIQTAALTGSSQIPPVRTTALEP